MKKAKKLLSVFLAVLMLYSCVAVGIGGIAVFAASASVSDAHKAVIAVPETVYMKPSTGQSTVGQYYVNNTVTSGNYTLGLEANNANTNGYVQFYVPGATDVQIAVNTVTSGIGDIVLAEAGASSGSYENTSLGSLIDANGYFTYTTVGLYISGTGLTAGQTALAEWVFTFTMNDGSTRTYYAYSTLYAPWYLPVGSATNAEAKDVWSQSMAWVSGVHGYTANSENKHWVAVTNETFDDDGDYTTRGNYYVKTSEKAMVPLIYGIGTANDNEDGVLNWIQTSSPGSDVTAATFRYYHYKYNTSAFNTSERSVMVTNVSPVANITVDTSRYTNFNQIPNLTVGFNMTDREGSNGVYWYASDFTDVAHQYTTANSGTSSGKPCFFNWTKRTKKDDITGFEDEWFNSSATGSIYAGSANGTTDYHTGVEYNSAYNRTIVTGSSTYDYIFKGAAHSYKDHRAYSINFIQLRATNVDKAALRNLVLEGASLNANNYTSATWEAYRTELRNAAQKLGTPASTDVATSDLTTKRDALQTTVTLNANGGSIGTTSFNVTVGATATPSYNVSAYTPTRTGYTFKGWATSSTATSGSTTSVTAGLMPTLYATWQANSYSVVFDNLIDFSKWNTTTASNATFSNVTSNSFTLTSNAGVGEGTSTSPLFPVTAGKTYTVDIDFEGTNWDVYIFFYDANTSSGTGLEFKDGADRRFSSSGVGNFDENGKPYFVAPTGAVKAVIRVDANGASNSVTFKNIRVYEQSAVEDGVSYETSKSVTYNTALGTLPTPTKENYDFLGWYTTDGTKVDSSTVMGADNLYLVSKWKVSGFTITWKVDGQADVTSIVKSGETPAYPNGTPTKAATAQYTYTFKGWSPALAPATEDTTYTAQFDATVNKYTVTWVVDGKTVKTEEVAYGSMPTEPATPTKEGNAQYSYEFAGWDTTPAAVTKDVTYTAKFNQITNNYKVTWYDEDGTTVLDSQTLAYGATPVYGGEQPTKAADNGYTYEFAGWTPTVSNVTGEAAYRATYKATLIPYTITLDAGEGSVAQNTVSYNYESTSVTLPVPTRTGYTFTGWTIKTAAGSWSGSDSYNGTVTLSNAYGNVTLEANYTPTEYKVIIDLNDDNYYGTATNTNYSQFSVLYNSTLSGFLADTDIERAGYTFAGWYTVATGGTDADKFDPTATYTTAGDTTVYAYWTPIEYTLTLRNYNGTSFANGETYAITYNIETNITLPLIEREGYTFDYWSKGLGNAGNWPAAGAQYKPDALDLGDGHTGNVTLTPYFTAKTYTITWQNYDGSVLKTDTVAYDDTPVYSGETPVKPADAQYSYVFNGWTPAVTPVTGAQTYTATYTQTERTYTIKFLDADGSEISVQVLKYGEAPEVPADPTKESDAQYNYTFVSWKDEDGNAVDTIPNVAGDATYTADYTATLRSYTITWIVDGKTTTTTVEYGETPSYGSTPVKEKDAQYTYTFAGWSPVIATVTGEATYTAQFDTETNSYTVKFVDENGKVLDQQTLEYGKTPEYAGVTPTKAPDAQYTYTFDGWTPDIDTVTGDITYTVKYATTVNKYTITFYDEDGTTVLEQQTIEYGETPVYAGNIPTKAATVQYTYTFAGWTTDLVSVTGNADYIAKYDATVNKYTITFYDEDGTTVLKSEDVAYGSMPAAPETPIKASTAQYSYTFAGWTPEVVSVTGKASYKATYTETVNKYTIKFVNDDGTVIQSTEVEYGTVPTVPAETPTKAADAQYTYTFNGWDEIVVAVTGEATYTATYSKKVNQYKVTFVDDDGSVIETQTLDYGAMPTAPADPAKDATAEWTYTFSGWTPEIVTVTGDATYKAQYTATKNSYTVTFVDDNGTVLKTESVEYGAMPTTPAAPTKASTAQYDYTFAGWTPNVTAVTGIATYTATYTETVREYTVTFYDENGTTELYKNKFVYGSTPVYGGETPKKEADAEFIYDFSGWSASQNGEVLTALPSVTGDASYYAVYVSTNTEFNVTWYNEDGTVAKTETVIYGTFASDLTFPAADNRASTAQYHFTYVGWNVSADAETALNLNEYKITADTSFYPAYSKTVREYKVTFVDEDGKELQSGNVPYGTVPTAPADPEKAATAQYTYTFAGWTPNVVAVTGEATYTATYSSTVNKYTVTFVDDDGSTLKTESVEYGKMPTAPADPTKAATAQYTYTFAGWNTEIAEVTGNVTYIATYTATVNKYLIKFVNEDGTELQSSEVEYGETPAYTGATPTKAATAQYTYTFAGWSPAVVSVTGVATYTATYTATVNEYTITFVDEDGTVLQSGNVPYGTVPTAPADPTKAATAQYTYTFAGWTPNVVEVTGVATYTATYTATVNEYTITFVNYDGTVLSNQTLEYGTVPTAPADPTKAADAQYTYTFAGWNTEIVAVTGNATYTATYDSIVNKYLITFVNEDGTELQSSEVAYGETPAYTGATPTKAATAQYTYTFADWSPVIVPVTGVATYTATYTATVNEYTITFVNEDGTELQSSEVAYGETPDYTGETPTKASTAQYSFTFDKWSPAIESVTGEATYTATYKETVRSYEITWLDDEGNIIDTTTVKYGDMPTHADPTKASTAQYDYTFAGWTPTVESVTGEATYTATFTAEVRSYEITWLDDEGKLIDTTTVKYGEVPTHADPTKASTVQYDYTFAGWTPEVVSVTGIATYKATYTETVRKYTVTWITGAGEFTGSWEYGSTPDPDVDNVDKSKAATAEREFIFSAWDKAITTVTGDVTYTAQYSEEIRSYTVTYVVDGVTVDVQTIKFGSDFSHPAIPAKLGHDSHWDISFMTMPAQDVTAVAVYTPKKYTVTWVADDKTVYTEQVAYGTEIPEKAVPAKVGHSGEWVDVPATMPAEAITITAVYTANSYNVVWSFVYGSDKATATYGEDFEYTFDYYINPVAVRITVNGVVLSNEEYTYDMNTGYLWISGTSIIGTVSISEQAAEGFVNVVLSAANATLTTTSAVLQEGTAFHTQILPNDGYLVPETIVVCIDGIELHDGYSYDANTGRITINAEVITGELSIRFDCPVNPNYKPGSSSDNCTCNCHSDSAFVRFFFSIATFFRKIFGMTQYQHCECGAAHW